jgi:hypothetical protein
MQYKVIPFSASVGRGGNSGSVASQLQNEIESHAADGWQYQRMESVETYVAGSNGCFGIGAQPGTNTFIKVLVFSKS